MSDRVAVIGEGAWGTAIALLLADNGYTVNLWCHDPAVADAIQTKRYNERYFPDVVIPQAIVPMTDGAMVLKDVTYIFEAIPVRYMRSVFTMLKLYLQKHQKVIVLSKGIEQDTLLFPVDLINETIGFAIEQAVVAGPSFAHEVAGKKTTAVSLAATCELAETIQPMMANGYFKPYISTDVIGVQVGAALKNVMALGRGMAEGAGLSENTQAFLLTRGLAEMAQLAVQLGGRQETIYGLSGVGDLILSSMGAQGRNAAMGRYIGHGKSLEDIKDIFDVLPESANTVISLYQMMQRYHLDLPVCQGMYEVMYADKRITDVIAALMDRPLEYECAS